jgi:membrane fusion protein
VNAPEGSLFRREVLERRVDRLHGEISLVLPTSWQLIGFLLLGGLAVATAFLAAASYSRVERVTGEIVLDTGVAPVVASRSGTVAAIAIRDGQAVRAGQPLVQIRSEEDMPEGDTGSIRTLSALREQDSQLATQASRLAEAAAAERSRLAAEMNGAAEAAARIEERIENQRRLVEVAEGEYREARRIAANGFISQRDLNGREAVLLTRRQQLSQLFQDRDGKREERAAARQAIARSAAAAGAERAALQFSRDQVAQEKARAEAARGAALAAPLDGVVTALTAHLGQPVEQGQPLLVIVPSRGRVEVDLFVPTEAAGFLALGQEVRIAVDAFPAQRFGSLSGRITAISSVAVPRRLTDGHTGPVYLVRAELPHSWVAGFGPRQRLLPGMTLTARIVTERRSLFDWLVEPLLAVRGR